MFDRNQGIGASEAAIVVGLSPWKTPLELWRDKRGLSERGKPTIPQRAGNALEPIVIEELEERIGKPVTNRQDQFFDKELPWRWATIDGLAGNALVEAKTASSTDGWGDEGTDQIPQQYIVQVQHAFACTGTEFAYVPVLFGTREFRVYEVQRNDDIIKAVTQHEKEFWRRVQENDPPAISDSRDIKIRWPVDTGASVVADSATMSAYAELASHKVTLKDLEKMVEDHEDSIKTFMQDASQLVGLDGKVLVTWKKSKDGTKFDIDAFKAAHPELWSQYQKPTVGTRRFLVK